MRRPATMMGGLSEKYLKFTLGKPKCTCPSSRGTAIINRIRLSLLSSSHIRCTHLSRLSRNQILLNATHFLSPPLFSPKCRFEYKRSEIPTRYYCYCGKIEDPPLDPWLVPHSCGQVCEKVFKPPCGHRCLLLCHPGM